MKMKVDYLLYIVIALLVIIRFTFLDKLPIFSDEAQNLFLAEGTLKSPLFALESVSYGVFPVTIWLLAFFQFITFNSLDPLILGRLVLGGVDILSCLFVFFIGHKLISRRLGLVSAMIYLLIPLNILHGRVVLLESLTNFFVLLLIYLFLKGVLENRLDKISPIWIITTSLLLVLAFFTKPLAAISFPVLLLIPLCIKNKKLKFVYLNVLSMFALGGTLTLLLYIPASAEFGSRYVSETNSLVSLATAAYLNFRKMILWSNTYFTFPLIILSLVSMVLIIRRRQRQLFWITGWIVVIVFLSVPFAKGFYPRHLFLLSAPIALLSGYFLTQIKLPRLILIVLLIGVFILPLKQDFYLVTNPKKADLALEDRQQFFEDWTSGDGNKEVAVFIKDFSKNQETVVYIEDSPYQYWSFSKLYDLGKAELIASPELKNGQFIDTSKIPANELILVVINQPINIPNVGIEKIFTYPKGSNDEISVYRLRN